MKIEFLLIIVAASLISAGCSKSNSSTPAPGPTVTAPVLSVTTAVSAIAPTSATSGGNVSSDGGANVTSRGVCWNTTTGPTISNSKTVDGGGKGIFTSSLTSLTAGTIYYVRAYATNSVGTAYGNELSFTTMTSSTSGVYVAGFDNGIAKLWKNGVATSLTNGSFAYGASVFVTNTDVYVAGSENVLGQRLAKLWTNGVPTTLNSSGSNYAHANSVYVAGSDVYVAGYERNGTVADAAKVWKNGVATSLTNGDYTSAINSVFVSGTDFYLAGPEYNGVLQEAKLWKNGVVTSLTNGVTNTRDISVFVAGTDVYVVGEEYTNSGKSTAMFWKNGVATPLTNGPGNGGHTQFLFRVQMFM